MKQIREVDIETLLFEEGGHILDLADVRRLLKHLLHPNVQAKVNITFSFDPNEELLSKFWKTHHDIFKRELPLLKSRYEIAWRHDDLIVEEEEDAERVVDAMLDIIYSD